MQWFQKNFELHRSQHFMSSHVSHFHILLEQFYLDSSRGGNICPALCWSSLRYPPFIAHNRKIDIASRKQLWILLNNLYLTMQRANWLTVEYIFFCRKLGPRNFQKTVKNQAIFWSLSIQIILSVLKYHLTKQSDKNYLSTESMKPTFMDEIDWSAIRIFHCFSLSCLEWYDELFMFPIKW